MEIYNIWLGGYKAKKMKSANFMASMEDLCIDLIGEYWRDLSNVDKERLIVKAIENTIEKYQIKDIHYILRGLKQKGETSLNVPKENKK